MREFITSELSKSVDLFTRLSSDEAYLDAIGAAVATSVIALKSGGKLLFAGNGGSASDAQHLAAELVCRLKDDRPAIAAISLATDTSILTAAGNDYGYEHVFSRQVEALGRKGDVLFAISTSGNSANILKAVDAAKKLGVLTIGLTGKSGGKLADACDIAIHIPSDETAKIQEGHITTGHMICALIEQGVA